MVFRLMTSAILIWGAASVCPAEAPSFMREIRPILHRSCAGCHHPGKMKGELDLTTYGGLIQGGETGPAVAAGKPEESLVITMVSGPEPAMPMKGEPLTAEEIALFEQWIRAGAADDTPAESEKEPRKPPVYFTAPAVPALAWSPDGSLLAAAAYHEIVLHQTDGSGMAARLVGESPRIEALAFSADGAWLVACGGAPARFGEVQVWDAAGRALKASYRVGADALYGLSLSPDATHAAFGCADNTVRMIRLSDGEEVLRFENHTDWVLATVFTVDGRRLVSGSRDQAMKIINLANGQFIDDINNPLEPVLCFSRHPERDEIVYGGGLGHARIYRISDNQQRTNERNDTNLVLTFERQPGPVTAIAWSPDGKSVALGNTAGEVRVYDAEEGKRVAAFDDHVGAVFTLQWRPDGTQLATSGFDGAVRVYDVASGEMVLVFDAAPVLTEEKFLAALGGDAEPKVEGLGSEEFLNLIK
jgi:WD40 repeat protein